MCKKCKEIIGYLDSEGIDRDKVKEFKFHLEMLHEYVK